MAKVAAKVMDQEASNLLRVQSARFHSAVQFEGGLGSKSKLTWGEQGCELYWGEGELLVRLPKFADQTVPNVMVFTHK